ncbi:hypothetical protein BS78_10G202800 [Paspalum vaginatum]|nr:hypothetical protein BS78_10G202800 [Paspalum vaginatum]
MKDVGRPTHHVRTPMSAAMESGECRFEDPVPFGKKKGIGDKDGNAFVSLTLSIHHLPCVQLQTPRNGIGPHVFPLCSRFGKCCGALHCL